MAAFMEVGDIWEYGIHDGQNSYFICMGCKESATHGTLWKLYGLTDVDMTNLHEYPDETFQRVVRDRMMRLVSRVNKNA
jgi:hypothetical protein